MHYSLFNPGIVSLIFDGERYEFKPFSLSERIRVANYFSKSEKSSIEKSLLYIEGVLQNRNNDNEFFNVVCDLIFIMMKDSSFFVSPCHFKKLIEKTYQKDKSILNQLLYFININISNSLPLEVSEDEKETNQKQDKQKEIPVIDWVKIYVIISREIKYTIKEFYDLTQRQIFSILKEVAEQKYNEYVNKFGGTGILQTQNKQTENWLKKPSEFSTEKDDFLNNVSSEGMKDLNPLEERAKVKNK